MLKHNTGYRYKVRHSYFTVPIRYAFSAIYEKNLFTANNNQ